MKTALKKESFTEAYLEFSHTLSRLLADKPPQKMAVALSGGADSMCLTLFLQQWAHSKNIHLSALTVDHKLRPESTTEAAQVAEWMQSLNIDHHILTWNKDSYPRNIQASARNARYDLLTAWCRENKVSFLAMAHNQDDQVETLLQRLAHHTGPLGLSGIPDIRELDRVTIIRPLLDFPRGRILQAIEEIHPWIEDPSNQNPTYTRVKIRHNNLTQNENLRNRLLQFRKTIAQQRMQLETESKEFFDNNVRVFQEGYCSVDVEDLKKLEDNVLESVITECIWLISGKDYPVSTQKLERVIADLFSGKQLSCHGCILQTVRGKLLVCREAKNIEDKVQKNLGNTVLWDNRFKVSLSDNQQVRKIGSRWIDFKDSEKMLSLPLAVRPTLPGIWEKETLLKVPHLSYDDSLKVESSHKILFYPTIRFCRSRFIFN